MENLYLNIAYINKNSTTNGPGNRCVIWFQGCPLNCKGCINQDFKSNINKHLISIDTLYKFILKIKGIEGVTYTGGEPFLQAKSLYFLTKKLKEHKLTIMAYSGFSYEQLLSSSDIYKKLLIEQLDILVDGPFEQNNLKYLLWRSSSNQRVFFLSDRYKNYEHKVNEITKEMEIIIYKDNIITTGNLIDFNN